MKANPDYPTIREFAREGPLGENSLRKLQRKGELPGVYVGNHFKIDKKAFLSQLDAASADGRRLV